MTLILLLCLSAVAVNLPFGFYRAGVPRLSLRWFLAIHLPVPLVIIMRLASGGSWDLVPLMFVCAALGQFGGGWVRSGMSRQQASEKVRVEKE